MSPYLFLLILEFFPARLATLPHGLDSNITHLLANLLTKPSVFYYLPIVSCNLVSIKLLLYYYYYYIHSHRPSGYQTPAEAPHRKCQLPAHNLKLRNHKSFWSRNLKKVKVSDKIDRVNSNRVAKPMISFNMFHAVACWVTSSWAIIFFVLSLHLPLLSPYTWSSPLASAHNAYCSPYLNRRR